MFPSCKCVYVPVPGENGRKWVIWLVICHLNFIRMQSQRNTTPTFLMYQSIFLTEV